MKNSISFKRDYHIMLPGALIPTKLNDRATVLVKKCSDDDCEEDPVSRYAERIEMDSDGNGFSIDIEDPHEMRFSFQGDFSCSSDDGIMKCNIGNPMQKEFEKSGEFVSSFETNKLKLNAFPIRHPWQLAIHTGMNVGLPVLMMIPKIPPLNVFDPIVAPLGATLLASAGGMMTPEPTEILFIEGENRNNRWFVNNMEDEIHEINIKPNDIKSVNLDMSHPMISTAEIEFEKTLQCKILADPKWITEKKKLYCE